MVARFLTFTFHTVVGATHLRCGGSLILWSFHYV